MPSPRKSYFSQGLKAEDALTHWQNLSGCVGVETTGLVYLSESRLCYRLRLLPGDQFSCSWGWVRRLLQEGRFVSLAAAVGMWGAVPLCSRVPRERCCTCSEGRGRTGLQEAQSLNQRFFCKAGWFSREISRSPAFGGRIPQYLAGCPVPWRFFHLQEGPVWFDLGLLHSYAAAGWHQRSLCAFLLLFNPSFFTK